MKNSPAAASAASSAAPAPRMFVVYLKLVTVTLFWGGTFIAGRVLAPLLPPMTAATGRFAIACALLLALARRAEGGLPRLNGRQIAVTAALGLTGIFIYNLCFFLALARMPAGRTALFIAFNPTVTALAAALFLRERLSPSKWLGIALAFCGVAIIITRGAPLAALHDLSKSVGLGELLMLLGICSWAAYTLIGRFALKEMSPLAATTYAALWGFLLLACGAATEWPQVDFGRAGWQAWTAIAYLGIFGVVISFVWYYEGRESHRPFAHRDFQQPGAGVRRGAGSADPRRAGAGLDGGRRTDHHRRRHPDQPRRRKMKRAAERATELATSRRPNAPCPS